MHNSKYNRKQHDATLFGICFVNISRVIHFAAEETRPWKTEILKE